VLGGEAVPVLPEGAGLGWVREDFEELGFREVRVEGVEVVDGSDLEVVHVPELGDAGEVCLVWVGEPFGGFRLHGVEARESIEDASAMVVDDGEDAACGFDLGEDEGGGEVVEGGEVA